MTGIKKKGTKNHKKVLTIACFFVIIKSVARNGELSERSKEPVLKTGDVKASVGSNPTLSSKFNNRVCEIKVLPRQ